MGKVLCGGVGESFATKAAVKCDSDAFCGCFALIALQKVLGEAGGRFENSKELYVVNREG